MAESSDVVRYSGVCKACGASAWQLVPGPVPGSARHTNGEADHEVVVVAGPLKRVAGDFFQRRGA